MLEMIMAVPIDNIVALVLGDDDMGSFVDSIRISPLVLVTSLQISQIWSNIAILVGASGYPPTTKCRHRLAGIGCPLPTPFRCLQNIRFRDLRDSSFPA
eukprot:COSAG05_NODE_1981_length_3754_cov_8.506156_2_plen_99_part_00